MRLHAVLLAVLVALLVATPARAATTIGRTIAPDSFNCDGPNTELQVYSVAGTPYVASGPGVITAWHIREGLTLPTSLSFITARAGTTNYTVESLDPAGPQVAGMVNDTPARTPIEAGDAIGFEEGGFDNCLKVSGYAGDVVGGETALPTTGSTLSLGTSGGYLIPVSATEEPDVDGDGYGDETQDGCPQSAAVFMTACPADLTLSQFASGSAPAGAAAVLNVNVHNLTALPASSAILHETLPAGLTLVSGSGPCSQSGSTVTCGVGNLPANGLASFQLAVATSAPGSFQVTGSVTSSADPNPANNAASASVTATAPPRVAAKLCRVPRLSGLTTAAARGRLSRAGCHLGRVRFRGAKPKKGQKVLVSAQGVPAGTRVALGTRIDVSTRAHGRAKRR